VLLFEILPRMPLDEYIIDRETEFLVTGIVKNKAEELAEWLKWVEHLPSKCETLSSNPSTEKKKKQQTKRTRLRLEPW
jgi:low affinity Fe/Cu permease